MLKILYLGIVVLILSACTNKQIEINPKYTINKKVDKVLISLKKGKQISLDELVDEVENYSVIFVGDHHNTKKTHKFFENFLDSLGKKGYNIHLANEWFSPKHNKLLNDYTSDKIDAFDLEEKRKWQEFSSYSWEIVEPLYEVVKKHKGMLYGVNIDKNARKKISLRQKNKMNKDEKYFYDNLDLNVTSHQSLVMPFFKKCLKRNIAISKEPCDKRMYRVQVTWDTYMANQSYDIAKRVLKNKKDKLIVFAGAMHMEYGLGIPLRFSRLSNIPFYIISNYKYSNKKNIKIQVKKADTLFLYKDIKE